jgi:hypothetical protein
MISKIEPKLRLPLASVQQCFEVRTNFWLNYSPILHKLVRLKLEYKTYISVCWIFFCKIKTLAIRTFASHKSLTSWLRKEKWKCAYWSNKKLIVKHVRICRVIYNERFSIVAKQRRLKITDWGSERTLLCNLTCLYFNLDEILTSKYIILFCVIWNENYCSCCLTSCYTLGRLACAVSVPKNGLVILSFSLE